LTPVFETIRKAAASRQLDAVRVDETVPLSDDIPAEIRKEIRYSRLVIADITGNNPNVLLRWGWPRPSANPDHHHPGPPQ